MPVPQQLILNWEAVETRETRVLLKEVGCYGLATESSLPCPLHFSPLTREQPLSQVPTDMGTASTTGSHHHELSCSTVPSPP